MLRLLYTSLFLLLTSSTIAQQSEKVTLLCNWDDTSLILNNKGARYNNVWGFTQGGNEYAAVGSTEGVHIIDVRNCRQVAFARSSSWGEHVINKDYKTYRNYLYAVCDQGGGSRLEIYDLKYLPDSLHQVYVSDPSDVTRTHSIFIDSAKAKIYHGIRSYVVDNGSGPTNATVNMSVYSLEDPEHPQFLVDFNAVDQIHDMYVRNDTAYCSASNRGYVVADFSGNTTYQILGVMPYYDYQGYNHSSWINSSGIGVMADETFGMPVKVINTKEINNIEVISTFSPRPGDSTCVPHNPYILNENYALVSYYMDGLQIYNISKPDSVFRTGYYDTYPGPNFKGYVGAWGCYPFLPSGRILVSDMQTGLYVLNADTALNLHLKKTPLPETKPFAIYPNPAHEKLNITLPDEKGDISISVCDVQGRIIIKQSIYIDTPSNQGIELPLPRNCPAGLYTIHIIAGSNAYTGKFIKAQN